MRRSIVTALMAAALASAGAGRGVAAQSNVPCDAFRSNPDGSWTALYNVRFPNPGQPLNLIGGSVFRPGNYILGNDIAATLTESCASAPAPALAPQPPPQQAGLPAHGGGNGIVDMETLTCGELVETDRENAGFLLAWYSGWSNGLAKNHTMSVPAVKDGIRNVIGYCMANKSKRVSEAVDVVRRLDKH